ncbi:MAG: DUF411 domain-containing protein [Acidobacteria bacterium]|nr:DUF411 domain-containing protein [Acidobacteriota bacterium]
MSEHAGHDTTAATSRRPWRLTWVGGAIGLVAVIGIAVAVSTGRSAEAARQSVIEVYKDPACGCCSLWVEHLREHGFAVTARDTRNLAALKTENGVPREMQSCHTALVDGYVIEGHVPAADVERLLRDRPAIAGLAVAGMPIGSPGMEVEGVAAQPYDVMAFDDGGGAFVFASHGD